MFKKKRPSAAILTLVSIGMLYSVSAMEQQPESKSNQPQKPEIIEVEKERLIRNRMLMKEAMEEK